MIMSGVSLRVLKDIMGHQDIKTTMIYAHLSKDYLIGATEVLSDRFAFGPERDGYLGEPEYREQIECRAPECDEDALYKGYCTKHYWQVKRHGKLKPETERNVQRRKDK